MKKIYTVCGNGIGSSLMCAAKVQELCDELGVEADVSSSDLSQATGLTADLIVTVKELATQLEGKNVAIIRSYTNKKKIKEDIEEKLLQLK